MKSKTYIAALGYNWLTNFYDLAISITMPEKRFRTKLIDLVNPLEGEKILEFGFGTGENLILGVNRNSNVQFKGLDIDPKVKRIAEKKFKANSIDVRLDIYNGGKFPYQNNAFDKVFRYTGYLNRMEC